MTAQRALCVGLASIVGLAVGVGCDRKWDFECTAVWEKRNGEELSREVYSYAQMSDENAATARCKDAMLDTRPKRGKVATCHCVGKE